MQRAARLAAIASGESGLGKVRQHVNPLSPAFKDPIPSPDFSQVFPLASPQVLKVARTPFTLSPSISCIDQSCMSCI